jgi:3-oxoacyl-[acyl-carrier protein] reductase
MYFGGFFLPLSTLNHNDQEDMNIQLSSKNALIGGIGAGIAIELAKCGANVT